MRIFFCSLKRLMVVETILGSIKSNLRMIYVDHVLEIHPQLELRDYYRILSTWHGLLFIRIILYAALERHQAS